MSTLIESPLTAILQVAAESADGSKRRIDCKFYGMEGKRLGLNSPERVAVLMPVTVEYNDALFLGEVTACRANAVEGFDIEMGVEQILTGLESLMVLRARLLGEGFASTAPAAVGTPVGVASSRYRDGR